MAASESESVPPLPATEGPEDGDGGGEGKEDEESEALMSRAQKLVDMVTCSQDNPKAKVLPALASVLETQESRLVFDHVVYFPSI